MRYAILMMAVVIAFLMFLIMYPMYKFAEHRAQVINCSIAEISPDFTTEMREACRKARAENAK